MEWDESTQMSGFAFGGADRILIADGSRARTHWLRAALGDMLRVEVAEQSRGVFERLTADPPRILVVGTDLTDISGTLLLAHAARHRLVGPHNGPIVFLLADTPETAAAVDEQHIPVFYRLTPALQPDRVRELFHQAFSKHDQQPAKPAAQPEDVGRSRELLEYAKRLGAQSDLTAAAAVAESALIAVCRADRARVLFFDDDTGLLWCETKDGLVESPASAGIAGFVVKTGSSVALERAGNDPGYRAEVDDPGGTGAERLAMVTVRDRDRKVHAVLIAVRAAPNAPFDAADLRLMESLAQAWEPYIHQLAREAEANAAKAEGHGERQDMFRQEAIQHMMRRGHDGDVVRVNPAWVSSAYWMVLVALIAAGVFGYFVQIHQYSEGPSVVKVTGRSEVISFDGGTVTGVEVTNGQKVTAGTVLARLHDTEQAGKLRGLEAEFERKLVAYLQTPADPNVRQALGQVVSERDSAAAGVDARVLRAPHDGIIKDVRVRNGQRVEAGSVVMSIARSDQPEGLSVLAFLPGSDRPRLRAKQHLRLTLPGYRGVHFEMVVQAISSDVLGASEAATRYLGNRLSDSVALKGQVVVVEGRLPSAHFETDGETYELHDGMLGTAEVQLDSKSVLETVFPGISR